ncbi:MAG: M36 family metallopeptidase, partial [Mycobacteriales bacterium]
VVSTAPATAATVDVSAATGLVLAVRSDARRLDGSTKVFDPNPIVTSRDLSLRQPMETGLPVDADLDSDALTAQRRTLPLLSLDDAALALGRLSGPSVNILGGGYNATVNAGLFDVTRSDPRFEGLMAYAHLDRYQRYLQGLGFRGTAAVNAEPQDVLAGGALGFDNSFYYGFADVIVYGDGGVDDAEDAEIVLHEYGHAMQDAQVPGFGYTTESGAMGEGFGDFNAAAYYARTSGGFGDTCFAEWDYSSSARGADRCLRRLDGTKRYPRDMVDEVHDDGEIWSAFLWQVRAGLPGNAAAKSDASLRLVISSHELLGSEASFAEAVDALRTTARALGHPEWVRIIERAATSRGLPLEPDF